MPPLRRSHATCAAAIIAIGHQVFQIVPRFAFRCAADARNRQEKSAMLAKHDVAVRIGMLLLPGLLYAMPAVSEGERDSKRSAGASEQSKLPPAPVGHRQPTAADIPKDQPKDPAEIEREKRDRELDAKLRICRNC
jgi:hypothetical protein